MFAVFGPSDIDYQRRGEDELAKLICKILQAAANIDLHKRIIYYHSYKPLIIQANEALEGPAWDFHWQMKHLRKDCNSFYFDKVFDKTNEGWLKTEMGYLITSRNIVAHKQYLRDKNMLKAGGAHSIPTLLDRMVTFAETICSDCKIPVRYHRLGGCIVLKL